MILKKYLINSLLILIIFFSFTEKSFSINSEEFVQKTADRASDALANKFTKEQKIKKLKNIAKETVDINGIGFYTLSSHRKNMTKEQKEQYTILFKKYFLKSFSSRLAEYTDPKVKVQSSERLNENYTIVSSILVAKDNRPEIEINWRVYTKNPNNLLIRDLTIEGLSLARTQKEEFNSIIKSNNGDINSLFLSLREFIKK